MALHEQCVGKTNEWYTPPHVFDALGCKFHTDVASPGADVTPWIPADHFLTKADEPVWCGFIWMNPPFGGRNGILPWLRWFFQHGNGIALTPDRTSAPWWQAAAPRADAILFIAPKLKFIGSDGKPGASPAQGTCLMASGSRAVNALYRARERGLGVLMGPAFPSRDVVDPTDPTFVKDQAHRERIEKGTAASSHDGLSEKPMSAEVPHDAARR